MAHFNFVISRNAKWGHASFYIDCHRMTSLLTCAWLISDKSKIKICVPENILLQKKHWRQHSPDNIAGLMRRSVINEHVSLNAGGFLTKLEKRGQSKEASILWSHNEETRELPGERDNARNNARCTQAKKTAHGLDGQHQDVDRTLRGRVNQNDRGQR